MKLSITVSKIQDIMYTMITLIVIFLTNNSKYLKSDKILLGIVIVILSIALFRKYKYDTLYCIVFGVILYINFSLVLSDCFFDGQLSLPNNTLSWQKYRGSIYEIYFLQGILLFLTTLNLLYINNGRKKKKQLEIIANRDSKIIYWTLIMVLFFIYYHGYSSIQGNAYESNTSVMYEYALMIFLLAWFYAGKARSRHVILIVYAILYCIQAISFGDRSSAFPMVLIIFILYLKKIEAKTIIPLAFLGIIVSNMISVYRQSYSLNSFLHNYVMRYGLLNFTSDTVSQSFYTGISLMAVKDMLYHTSGYFKDFVMGIIIGGDYANANITALGKLYTTNKGGGMIFSDFMFWFGLPGAVIVACVLVFFMYRLSANNNDFRFIWKIYFTITVFRWYLYTAFDLFRGVLFLFPICFGLLDLLYRLLCYKDKQSA